MHRIRVPGPAPQLEVRPAHSSAYGEASPRTRETGPVCGATGHCPEVWGSSRPQGLASQPAALGSLQRRLHSSPSSHTIERRGPHARERGLSLTGTRVALRGLGSRGRGGLPCPASAGLVTSVRTVKGLGAESRVKLRLSGQCASDSGQGRSSAKLDRGPSPGRCWGPRALGTQRLAASCCAAGPQEQGRVASCRSWSLGLGLARDAGCRGSGQPGVTQECGQRGTPGRVPQGPVLLRVF